MFAIIASDKYRNEIIEALVDEHVYYQQFGTFDEDSFIQNCTAAAGAQAQTLIIDMTCTDDRSLIRGIRKFRLTRNARIMVIAEGREPGDATISNLLKFQVYDFIVPVQILSDDDEEYEDEEGSESAATYDLSRTIKQHLKQQSSYAMAARWDVGNYEDVASGSKSRNRGTLSLPDFPKFPKGEAGNFQIRPDILQKVRESATTEIRTANDRALSDTIIGTIVIAVIGTEAGAGSTHTALLIANYLADKNRKTAIIEMGEHYDFAKIANAYDGERDYENEETVFRIDGVSYYKSTYHYDIAELLEQQYDYIVLDLGSHLENDYVEEFYRAHVQIVVGQGSEWRQDKILEFSVDHEQRDQSNWIYCIPLATDLTIADMQKEIHGIVVAIPAHPDPYQSQKNTATAIDSFMNKYLGSKPKTSLKQRFTVAGLGAAVVALLVALYLK